jgi:hypothetical protein
VCKQLKEDDEDSILTGNYIHIVCVLDFVLEYVTPEKYCFSETAVLTNLKLCVVDVKWCFQILFLVSAILSELKC